MAIQRNTMAMKDWENQVDNENNFVANSNATELGNITLANKGTSGRVFGNQIPVIHFDNENEFDYEENEEDKEM